MTTLYRIYMALGITCNLAMTKSTGRVGMGYKQILCHFLKTNFLSTGGFWFLSTVVDSALETPGDSFTQTRTPVESCPLTESHIEPQAQKGSGRLARP